MFEPLKDTTKYDYNHLQREYDRLQGKVFLGSSAAFFGPLLSSLEFYWSEEVDTAATDGVRLWWNPKFFLEAPTKYSEKRFNEAVMMHELGHVGRLHMLRQGIRDPKVFNYACDIRLNNDLVSEGYSFGTFPAWMGKQWDAGGIAAEEDIYDALMAQGFAPPPNPWGNGDLIEQSEEDIAKILSSVTRSVTNAKMEGKPGSIPGNTQTMLDHFLSPVLPWEQLMKQWMTDLCSMDYTWSRPNRRHNEIYLPSMFEDDGRLEHIVHFQDVSGSITNQEIIRFNSELKYLWDEFRPKRMTVIQFDTVIQKIDEFREGDEFVRIEITGRGGTDLSEVRQWIIDNKPTAATIFSDMMVAPMQPLPVEIPILWVASNAPGATVPFGKLVHIKTNTRPSW